MGIQGLIPFLKKASREVNVNLFQGGVAAVDAYCWIHKGAVFCSEQLAKGEPTSAYVHFCLKRVNMLISAGVKPILVFDGQCIPSKKGTESKRRQNRDLNRKKAKQFLREGKTREAKECFQRCLDVTPEMAHRVLEACHEIGVDCIVAPYEADAQLAYLARNGLAQVVITEDSDLVLFGCEKVLLKMDAMGQGLLLEGSKVNLCLGVKAESFTFEKFRYMCILSGCDYLPSLPGIGLAKSFKFFSLTTNPNLRQTLPRIPSYLKMPGLVITEEYIDGFIRADNTFLYQLIFCPREKILKPLNPYPIGMNKDEMDYAGSYYPDRLAFEIAIGKINYLDKKPFLNDDKKKDFDGKNGESIWDKTYVPPTLNKSKKCKESILDLGYVTQAKTVVIDSSPIIALTKKRSLELSPESTMDDILSQYHQKTPIKGNKSLDSPEDEEKIDLFPTPPKSQPRKVPSQREELWTPPKETEVVKPPKRQCQSEGGVVKSRFFNSGPAGSSRNVGKTSACLDSLENEDETPKKALSSSETIQPQVIDFKENLGIRKDNSDLLSKLNSFRWAKTPSKAALSLAPTPPMTGPIRKEMQEPLRDVQVFEVEEEASYTRIRPLVHLSKVVTPKRILAPNSRKVSSKVGRSKDQPSIREVLQSFAFVKR